MLVMLGIVDSAEESSYAFGISSSMQLSLQQQCIQAKIWMPPESRVCSQVEYSCGQPHLQIWSCLFADLMRPES